MPVKLSRFVRVMSGGNIVTDELVTVREGKVNAALDSVQAQLDRLTAAGLRIPALSDQMRVLTKARDDALNAGSNKAICEALEDVKFDARDAADQAKPLVDAALLTAQARTGKLGEVDTALNRARGVAGAITEPKFKAAASAPIAGLALRRKALADAAEPAAIQAQLDTADTLLGDIATAERDATAADRQAKAWLKACGDVTAAMSALRLVEGGITLAVFKAPMTAVADGLARRADTLDKAGDTGVMVTQTGLSVQLLKDIAKAENDAKAMKLVSEQFKNRRDKLDAFISTCEKWVNVLKAGTGDAVRADLLKVKSDRTALDTTPPTGFGAAIGALETAANKLYGDATTESASQTKTSADAWPPVFDGWVKRINAITTHNPVQTEVTALRLEKSTADGTTPAADRQRALSNFATHASALESKIGAMEQGKKDIERIGMTVSAVLSVKPTPTAPAWTALVQERLDKLAEIPGAFNQSNTDQVITQLALVKSGMEAIKTKAEDWRAGDIGRVKLNADVEKSLADARAAVDKLPSGTGKTELDDALRQLVVRKDATATLALAPANKALFALGKEAVVLLERARKAEFDDTLKAPDGKDKIKDLIAAMNGRAATPQDEALCRAALAARFKLDVEVLEGLSVDRLPQLYQVFEMVPEAHVGHDRLTKLEYNTDASLSTSYYQGAGNKIVLWMPGSEGNAPYKPQSGSGPTEQLNYFKATALHEIGHAVDAKKGIMSESRMASADFGGWKAETIDSVVIACYDSAFASFKASPGPTEPDLKAFIKSVLETGKCTKPASATAAMGSLFSKWDEIEAKSDSTCKKIRNADMSPWNTPVPFGTRAYHEGYSGKWFSYLTASRSKGVSDYQWRAPPEWFAEFYAYYYMTKKEIPDSVKEFVTGTEAVS